MDVQLETRIFYKSNYQLNMVTKIRISLLITNRRLKRGVFHMTAFIILIIEDILLEPTQDEEKSNYVSN